MKKSDFLTSVIALAIIGCNSDDSNNSGSGNQSGINQETIIPAIPENTNNCHDDTVYLESVFTDPDDQTNFYQYSIDKNGCDSPLKLRYFELTDNSSGTRVIDYINGNSDIGGSAVVIWATNNEDNIYFRIWNMDSEGYETTLRQISIYDQNSDEVRAYIPDSTIKTSDDYDDDTFSGFTLDATSGPSNTDYQEIKEIHALMQDTVALQVGDRVVVNKRTYFP